jgi:glycosyltransferase involved in cell wall biosynthesis
MLDRWSLSQRSWKKQPYIALVERTHLRRAGAIHATSTDEGQNIAALGYGARVHVIPLGVDLPSGSPRAVRPADGPLRLLFLSRLHPKKGLPLLLGAVAELSRGGANVELVVAGSGSEAYRAELSALCDRLGISERVRFLGHVEGDSKTEALRAADVFVLPSYQENFGIAIAEAMAAGVPVIVSDRVALADEIRSSGAGMVVPCEASAIAGAISRLGRAPEERYRMGENGIKLVRKRYSWDRTSRLLLDLYTQLANEARC